MLRVQMLLRAIVYTYVMYNINDKPAKTIQ